jgi:hypothetical protein
MAKHPNDCLRNFIAVAGALLATTRDTVLHSSWDSRETPGTAAPSMEAATNEGMVLTSRSHRVIGRPQVPSPCRPSRGRDESMNC